MKLTIHFELAYKSTYELKGLYRMLFNKLTDNNLTLQEKQPIFAALSKVKMALEMHYHL